MDVCMEQGIDLTRTRLGTHVYRAVVLPSLLHSRETLTWHRRLITELDPRLNQFHLRALGKILQVRIFQISRSFQELNCQALKPSWKPCTAPLVGTCLQMDDSRLSKQLFYNAQLLTGRLRHEGGQRKRYKDPLKLTLMAYTPQLTSKSASAGSVVKSI